LERAVLVQTPSPKVHTSIDLFFANVPENLRVPSISTSSSEVSQWNKRSSTYFEVLFPFASANLHDDDILVFAHAADPEVSRSIHNWVHTEDFYIAKDWFGMNDLDLRLPNNPSELVIFFGFIHSHFALFLSFVYSLFYSSNFLQTRKFFIKVLVRNKSILNVRTSDFEDMSYNLK
jgi:hypothetical protein